MDRNNTSFSKQLYETMKSIKQTEDDPLKYHQRLVVEYILKYPVRGLLIYHKMGAGKSILGVSICEKLLDLSNNNELNYKKVLFISSKSLHTNMKNTIVKYRKMIHPDEVPGDENLEERLKKYEFISINASNMINQVFKSVKPEGAEAAEKLFDYAANVVQDSSSLDGDEESSSTKEVLSDLIKKLNTQGNLNDTIVMVDEAHNLFNSIANGSTNATLLYHLIMNAKNIKVLFLTGSPIVNDPFEIAIAANMLVGKMDGGLTLFGEDYEDFQSYFVNSNVGGGIKNKEKFMNRIIGLVSYFGADSAKDLELYPKQLPTKVRKVPMSARQYTAYIAARDKEIEENNRKGRKVDKKQLTKPGGGKKTTYRVRSRQFSNFVYPEYAHSYYRDAGGYVRYEQYIDKLKDENLIIKNSSYKADDKSHDESKYGLEIYSPKFVMMLLDLNNHCYKKFLSESEVEKAKKTINYDLIEKKENENKIEKDVDDKSETKTKKGGGKDKDSKYPFQIGGGVIYSQFKDSGVDVFAKILKCYNFEEFNFDLSKKPRYAIINGEVDVETRQKIVDVFNSKENINGEIIQVLFVTSTGAEGIDLKNGRFVMVMEPYWHWSRISQIFARIRRLMSHFDLPVNKRYVQPYIYLSDYPSQSEFNKLKMKNEELLEMKKKMKELTTDLYLYYEGLQNQLTINTFRKALEEASIDCHLHYGDKSGPHKKCMMCAPTNRKLFIDNLDADIRTPSRCEPLKEEKVKVKTIFLEVDNASDDYGDTETDKETDKEKNKKDTDKKDKKDKKDKIKLEFKYSIDADKNIHIYKFNSSLNGYEEIFDDNPHYFNLISKVQ